MDVGVGVLVKVPVGVLVKVPVGAGVAVGVDVAVGVGVVVAVGNRADPATWISSMYHPAPPTPLSVARRKRTITLWLA